MAFGPHAKTLIGWGVVTTIALTAFYLSRVTVNEKRYQLMVEKRKKQREELANTKKASSEVWTHSTESSSSWRNFHN